MREDLTVYDESRDIFDGLDLPEDIENDGITHVHLGSRQPPCTITALQERHRDDIAFGAFLTRLTKFLRECLPETALPVGRFTIKDEVHYFLAHSASYANSPLGCWISISKSRV